jgi:hypothetical protein
VGTFVVGLIVGAVVGGAALYFLMRQARPAAGPGPGSSVTPEPALGAPVGEVPVPLSPPVLPVPPAPPGPAIAPKGEDDVRQALDASKGLIDELETRYRDRPPPPPDDEADEPKPTRRPRPKPRA